MTNIGSVRDATPNRSNQNGGTFPAQCAVSVMGGDIDRPTFFPTPGAIHTVAVAAAGRTWTISAAAIPLPYDLKIGQGFLFYVQNNGANTITLAVTNPGVVAGAGTITVATARTRIFSLTRISDAVHQLDTLGVLVQ